MHRGQLAIADHLAFGTGASKADSIASAIDFTWISGKPAIV